MGFFSYSEWDVVELGSVYSGAWIFSLGIYFLEMNG